MSDGMKYCPTAITLFKIDYYGEGCSAATDIGYLLFLGSH
jgi:hypothetical protein